MFLKDPKTGERSVTMTVLLASTGVALVKLLVSGMAFGSIVLDKFSGGDAAAVIAAAGAVYAARKHTDKSK